MSICNVYRGRMSLFELINAPFAYVQTLKYLIEQEMKTKEGKDRVAGEAIEDAMTGNL